MIWNNYLNLTRLKDFGLKPLCWFRTRWTFTFQVQCVPAYCESETCHFLPSPLPLLLSVSECSLLCAAWLHRQYLEIFLLRAISHIRYNVLNSLPTTQCTAVELDMKEWEKKNFGGLLVNAAGPSRYMLLKIWLSQTCCREVQLILP